MPRPFDGDKVPAHECYKTTRILLGPHKKQGYYRIVTREGHLMGTRSQPMNITKPQGYYMVPTKNKDITRLLQEKAI